MTTTPIYKTQMNTSSVVKPLRWLPLLLAFLAIAWSPCFGQEPVDTIRVQKTFFGYAYSQGGQRLSMNRLSDALVSNPEAYQIYQNAQSSGLVAQILAFAGGYMIGWPIGTAIGGGEPNWNLALIGTGLVFISIPLETGYNRKTQQAIDIFNNELPDKKTDKKPIDLELSLRGNGAGLIFTF
jgi:hypothetical protein